MTEAFILHSELQTLPTIYQRFTSTNPRPQLADELLLLFILKEVISFHCALVTVPTLPGLRRIFSRLSLAYLLKPFFLRIAMVS